MGFFSRRRARGGFIPPRHPDPALRNLDVADADDLRGLVRRAGAARGVPLEASGDHVRTANGVAFGLWNLSVAVAVLPRWEWDEVVTRHVDRVLGTTDLPVISDEVLARSVVLRLHQPAAVEAAGVGTQPAPHPDLVTALSVDLPDVVSTPPIEFWEARGGPARWQEDGRANLRRVLDEAGTYVAEIEGADGFVSVGGTSFFVASLALVIDHLVAEIGRPDQGRGLLVATPSRHQLILRPVTGRESLDGLRLMMAYAEHGFSTGAGPLDPTVFWVFDEEWTPLNGVERFPDTVVLDDDRMARALGFDPGMP